MFAGIRVPAGGAGTGVAELDLENIYARYRQGLFTLALSITGCATRAEDAVHDAFVRLCRGEIALTGDAVAYVFRSVRNAAITQMRRPRVPRGSGARDDSQAVDERSGAAGASVFDRPLSDEQTPGPLARAIEAEQQRSIADAVDALPPDVKEVVLMRIYSGLTSRRSRRSSARRWPPSRRVIGAAWERLRPGLKRLV